jgi:hypothetical protein
MSEFFTIEGKLTKTIEGNQYELKLSRNLHWINLNGD